MPINDPGDLPTSDWFAAKYQGERDAASANWDVRFRPWAHIQSPELAIQVLEQQVSDLSSQVASLSAMTLQLQAMIYEMWSGERSEVIIVPPHPPEVDLSHDGPGVLRLDV